MKKVAGALAVLTLVLSGCATKEEGTEEVVEKPAATQRVTFKTSEYSYDAPESFKGGLTEIELDNTGGKEAHEAELIILKDGKNAADYLAAAAAGGPPPEFALPAGGPGPVNPGKKAVYTANLAAGNYMFICHIPAPDGQEHVAKGMVGESRVTEGVDGTLPESDVTMAMSEFKFSGLEGLKAGTQTVKAVNIGQQPHHAALLQLTPGADPAEALAIASGQQAPTGPPPFLGFPGFVATFLPGQEATRTLELEAGGRYLFVCFIPDTDGTPHAAKGMQQLVQL